MDDKKKQALIVLGVIIIAGFLLRAYLLDSQSLWLDEAFSVYYSQQDLKSVITMQDPTPPLYYTLLHLWIQLTGISVFATRFLSVIFGTLSIFLVYLLAKSMFDERVGLCSAFLVALSPLQINYSQEARAYSLFFALSLLSMYFYYRISNGKKASNWSIIGYFLSTLFLLYSHFYGIFIVLAQGLHRAFADKLRLSKKLKLSRKMKLWLLLQAAILVFYLPWITKIIFMPSNAYSWIPKPSLLQLIYMLYSFFSGMAFSFYGLALTIICLALLIIYRKASEKKDRYKSSLLWLWIIAPIVAAFIFSWIFTPIFVPKYVYFVSLPLYILVSKAIFSLKPRKRMVLIGIIALLALASLWAQQNDIIRDPWNKVSGYVFENYHENDKVAIINSYQALPFSYYFDKECFMATDLYACSRAKGIYPIDTLGQLKAAAATGKGNFWLIVSRDIYDNDTINVLDHFNENYALEGSREYLLFQGSAFFNSLYNYFDKKEMIPLRLNKIRVFYFQEKEI